MMAVVRKIYCDVLHLTQHDEGVYSVYLAPHKKLPKFRPGQFCHLAIDDYDPSSFWPESRAFSIASSPKNREQLRICYSVVGNFTQRMQRNLYPGRGVWVKLPYGEFVVGDHQCTVLVAGGTGISPFLAFIEDLQEYNRHKVYLVYGARNEKLLIDVQMMLKKAMTISNFSLVLFSENGFNSTTLASSKAKCHCIEGRINSKLLTKLIAKDSSASIYLSGPPAMISKFKDDLKRDGVSPDHVYIDAWD